MSAPPLNGSVVAAQGSGTTIVGRSSLFVTNATRASAFLKTVEVALDDIDDAIGAAGVLLAGLAELTDEDRPEGQHLSFGWVIPKHDGATVLLRGELTVSVLNPDGRTRTFTGEPVTTWAEHGTDRPEQIAIMLPEFSKPDGVEPSWSEFERSPMEASGLWWRAGTTTQTADEVEPSESPEPAAPRVADQEAPRVAEPPVPAETPQNIDASGDSENTTSAEAHAVVSDEDSESTSEDRFESPEPEQDPSVPELGPEAAAEVPSEWPPPLPDAESDLGVEFVERLGATVGRAAVPPVANLERSSDFTDEGRTLGFHDDPPVDGTAHGTGATVDDPPNPPNPPDTSDPPDTSAPALPSQDAADAAPKAVPSTQVQAPPPSSTPLITGFPSSEDSDRAPDGSLVDPEPVPTPAPDAAPTPVADPTPTPAPTPVADAAARLGHWYDSMASTDAPVASDPPVNAGITVTAVHCPAAHSNPPHAENCRVCNQPITDRSITVIPRPLLGVLRFSDGRIAPVDGPLLLGRRPSGDYMVNGQLATAITIDDPDRSLSRNHVELRVSDWQVHIVDRDSTNGTFLTIPGRAPFRLRAGESYPMPLNSEVRLSDTVSCTFELHEPHRS